MKSRVVSVWAVLCGSALALCAGAAPCHAADKAKGGKADFALPSIQLGDYSVALDADEPRQTGAPEPSGLSTLRTDDSPRAFLGVSLSEPLPHNFWNFMR
ncbi:MAG: hypothetical protein P8Y53_04470 [Pseudolabrys sp.]